MMAELIQKDEEKAPEYLAKAEAMKTAINKWLWSDHLGRYGYFFIRMESQILPRKAVDFLFAVLFGVYDEEQAERILKNIEISDFGQVSIQPPFEGISSVEMPL